MSLSDSQLGELSTPSNQLDEPQSDKLQPSGTQPSGITFQRGLIIFACILLLFGIGFGIYVYVQKSKQSAKEAQAEADYKDLIRKKQLLFELEERGMA